jgi:prophage regulatory protein
MTIAKRCNSESEAKRWAGQYAGGYRVRSIVARGGTCTGSASGPGRSAAFADGPFNGTSTPLTGHGAERSGRTSSSLSPYTIGVPMITERAHAQNSAISLNNLVAFHVNLSKAQIYKLIARDEFPKPMKIGKSSLWLASEVDAWLEKQRDARDAEPDAPAKHGRKALAARKAARAVEGATA